MPTKTLASIFCGIFQTTKDIISASNMVYVTRNQLQKAGKSNKTCKTTYIKRHDGLINEH